MGVVLLIAGFCRVQQRCFIGKVAEGCLGDYVRWEHSHVVVPQRGGLEAEVEAIGSGGNPGREYHESAAMAQRGRSRTSAIFAVKYGGEIRECKGMLHHLGHA